MSGPIKLQQPLPVHPSQSAQRPSNGQIPKAYDQKMRQVAKLYETQFLREMHKAMKGTVQKSDFIKENMAEKIFQEKLDNQYIDKWAGKGGIGLADMIYQQLRERVMQATQGYVPRPQGPLPIKKGTVLKVDKSMQENQILNLPKEGQKAEGEVSFILKAPLEIGEPSPEVTSPWAGQLTQVAHLSNDQQVLRIQHDLGVDSLLSFQGSSALKEGDWIEAGQKLGVLIGQPQQVSWRVTS